MCDEGEVKVWIWKVFLSVQVDESQSDLAALKVCHSEPWLIVLHPRPPERKPLLSNEYSQG
jgi:hypothetical protein